MNISINKIMIIKIKPKGKMIFKLYNKMRCPNISPLKVTKIKFQIKN